MVHSADSLISIEFAASAAEFSQVGLKEGMRLESSTTQVDDSVDRIVSEKRAKIVNSRGVEPHELRENTDVPLKFVQGRAFVLAGMNQHRHVMAERLIREPGRRRVEKISAGEGKRSNQPVTKRIVNHRRASS